MGKRYRLLKDLPDCEAGRMVQYDEKAVEYFAITKGGSRIYFQERTIEDNPTWFELIKEGATVVNKITDLDPERNFSYDKTAIGVTFDRIVLESKFPAIKEAIEKVLND